VAKVLVIGANGFIGSHLVDELAAGGHEVTAFDRFSSQDPVFLPNPTVRLVVGDFLNRSDLELALAGQEYVLHFLSMTSPATAEDDPTLDVRTNIGQTVELLELCVSAGIRHFYFASTGGAIYGPQGKSEYVETDHTLPISPYGIGKLTIENYLRYFRAKHELESTSFRLSNPYGPRQGPHRKQGLIPIALRQIAEGNPVVQFGDGSMVRDYIYVEDLARMVASTLGKKTPHDVFNIGSGHGHSVSHVLDSLRRITGVHFDIEVQPTPPTFVDNVVLDTTRFRSQFGNFALTPLDEGVRRTYKEIRSQLIA
jgi:UDP-glucose 4-epimerase